MSSVLERDGRFFLGEKIRTKKVEKLFEAELKAKKYSKVLECFSTIHRDHQVLVDSGVTCVLVEGPSGCGKTSLLKELALSCGKWSGENLLYLHLGEQIDGKALLGTFTSTGSPGEFLWQQGVLTKAVQGGMWVILEDIDSAPSDVISLLLPLVKNRELLLPGCIDPIMASEGFMLFLTQRTKSSGTGSAALSNIHQVLRQHCAVLQMESMTLEQKKEIINFCHPNLSLLTDDLVSTSTNMNIHMRKLLKLCDRVSPQVYDGRLSSVQDFMLEVIDSVCGHLPLSERVAVALELRNLCGGMAKEKVEQLCRCHKPALKLSQSVVSIGRACLSTLSNGHTPKLYAHTQSSLSLLEKISVCVANNEPVLLVGETGVGKTATINYLAQLTGTKLVAMNMSQQTDSTDLLGGFKPIHFSRLLGPVRDKFEQLFFATFSGRKNKKYLEEIQLSFLNHRWKKMLSLMNTSIKSALSKHNLQNKCIPNLFEGWKKLSARIQKIRKDLHKPRSSFAFSFVEGALVEAVRLGHWILLDEINLATPETLQCLSGLLESPRDSFVIPEKPEQTAVERHSQFRLFCCMNPATDVGKKQLTLNIRNRFTEFFVDEIQSPSDFQVLIRSYLKNSFPSAQLVEGIIKLYQMMKELAETRLQDGTGRRPHYSLRSLCRALAYGEVNPCGTFKRSLYEGFCLTLLSELRSDQHALVKAHIQKSLKISDQCVTAPLPDPSSRDLSGAGHVTSPLHGAGTHGTHYKKVGGFFLRCDPDASRTPKDYILTDAVEKNLENLARALSARNYPILLQGPTSAGKTSLIQYIAESLGHQCLRVNNHEHTDLQEYVGSYTTNHKGELIFQEGVLVTAMRKGHWIILDELNLAPTEVLEALNRVLDDNRELFIPETQELVKAHSNFMLFGTQNPPGTYGGRKVLSRAFRNRFIELHFEDIPASELAKILHLRCHLPLSYAEKMVRVMKDLQERRSTSGIFAGKYGLITLRDLFRWAERYRKSNINEKFHDWDQQLAEDGFMLLGGRLREVHDEDVVREVIKKHFKRTIDPFSLFGFGGGEGSVASREALSSLKSSLPDQFSHLVWTDELLKVAVLVHRCLQFEEPVLLVGGTGCGKTTLCQLLSVLFHRQFFSINCHMYTEAADFLGGLRPVRRHQAKEGHIQEARIQDDSPFALFEWVDGVVVVAMKEGGCLLVDEISLADDAVLERLNSILEPERKLVVSERSRNHENEVFQISASQGFQFLATMNPGGDYGKKELSPALRNRFVEIWCPSSSSRDSCGRIIRHNLGHVFTMTDVKWDEIMLDVLEWLKHIPSMTISVRDILTWIRFMNITASSSLSPAQSFCHGAHLVFLDALGCGVTFGGSELKAAVSSQIESILNSYGIECGRSEQAVGMFQSDNDKCGILPFTISRGSSDCDVNGVYSLEAPGPKKNALCLLRAMQLGRPLLLEGPPGVGKTSLVIALAELSGHRAVRINLSEQTDVSDLFGCDLPVEGKAGSYFEWRDGPFLKALRNGDWIILDEMNLASQSVLEGLNACLDHRGEVYVPELGMTFKVPVETKIFACQNPLQQGGGRKGLPKSFINRFTQVHMEPLSSYDLLVIVSSVHPAIGTRLLEKMIEFTSKISSLFKASLWEFNLRDLFRWCQLMTSHQDESSWDPGSYVEVIFCSRFRDSRSRVMVRELFSEVFKGSGKTSVARLGSSFQISPSAVQIGGVCLERGYYLDEVKLERSGLLLLHSQLPALEALLYCVKMKWMAILVGPSCCGKSSVVQTLAALTGHKLLEFPMNSDTDTIDLLGGYEQVNLSRAFGNLMSSIQDVLVCVGTYVQRNDLNVEATEPIEEVLTEYVPGSVLDEMDMLQCCLKLKGVLKSSLLDLPFHMPHDIDGLVCEIDALIGRLESVRERGQFEWVDNVLVKALEHGHWLMITHANFCSASVLDRLNGLLEPGGILRMDERGIVGGSIKEIKPHPSFRLFLTMDSNHGEVSRAMRNRGLEIYLFPQELCASKVCVEDGLSLLLSGGLERDLACDVMKQLKGTPSLFQMKQFGKYHKALKLSSLCDDQLNDLTCKAARLCGLGLETESLDYGFSKSSLLASQGMKISLKECLSMPALTVTRRDMVPVLHALSNTPPAANQNIILGNSLFSGALLVFMSHSTLLDKSLRLTLLEDLVSQLVRQQILQAEVKISKQVMQSALKNWSPRGYSGLDDCGMETLVPVINAVGTNGNSVLAFLHVLRLQTIIEQHLQLSDLVDCKRSILSLSHQAYAGKYAVERLRCPALLYLHLCLQTVLGMMEEATRNENRHQEMMECCVDWLWTFITLCMDPSTDFSSIACIWTLMKNQGLLDFLRTIDTNSHFRVDEIFHHMKPLDELMKKNDIYLLLRDSVGSPEPPKTQSLKFKSFLMSKEVTRSLTRSGRGCFELLSGDCLELRRRLMQSWVDSLSEESMETESSAEQPENSLLISTDYVTTTSDHMTSAFDHMTSTSDHMATIEHITLLPAAVYLRQILVCQLNDTFESTPKKLESLIQYVVKSSQIQICELEPVLNWKLKIHESDSFKGLLLSLVEHLYSGFNMHCDKVETVTLQSCLSKVCFEYLTPQHPGGIGGALVPPVTPTLTIGNHQTRSREISTLLQFIWLQGSAGAYSISQYLTAERHIMQAELELLVAGIQNAIGHETACRVETISQDAIVKITKDARSFLAAYISSDSWSAIEHDLCSVISELRKFDECIIQSSDLELELLARLSSAKLRMGLALSSLVCPTALNPIVVSRTKHQVIHQQILQNSNLIGAWNNHFLVMAGKKFTDIFAADRLPPVLSGLVYKQNRLEKQLEDFPELPPIRDSTYKYRKLACLCADLAETMCSRRRVDTLLGEATVTKDANSSLKITSWSKSVLASLKKLRTEYASFCDITVPFSAGITQIVDGLNTLAAIERFKSESKMRSMDVIQRLSQFPFHFSVEQPISYIQWLITTASDGLSEYNLPLESINYTEKRLLLLAVSTLGEYMRPLPGPRGSHVSAAGRVLELCWSLWSKEEEARRTKEREEQSLYQYKTKTHLIEEAETDILEEQLNNFFPSYAEYMEEELGDDDQGIEDKREPKVVGNDGREMGVKFSVDELERIASLHMLLYAGDATCSPKRSVASKSATSSYELGSYLMQMMLGIIPGLNFDRVLLRSHANMCQSLLQSLVNTSDNDDYNIYKDPAPSETARSLAVVVALMNRVQELMLEWPDHQPTLFQITKACEKVLALDLQEPLMKVLAGLEYVLKKAQIWEEYASSKVSLFSQLEPLTHLILEWRKKELNAWKNFLQCSRREVMKEACKWWFYVYGLCRDQVQDEGSNDFISSLQKFMEMSTLGEFETRLRIIASFLADAHRKGATSLACYLGNVFVFYKQFSEAVEKAIQQLISPVEKEFNEHLSILRWNDGNYWAVKSSTEKSHRTIVKLINKHKAILHQPVQPVLTDASMTSGHQEGKQEHQHVISELNQLIGTLDTKNFTTSEPTRETGQAVLSSFELEEGISVSMAFQRMVSYIRAFTSSNMCSQWSLSINDITGSIIQTMQELQSDEYLKGLNPEKRKAGIKLRNLQKRKALSNLFKTLKHEGLSYRKGIEHSEDFRLYSFKLPHQRLPAPLGADKTVKRVWDKMESYYYRCIARMASFQSSFQNPTKELTLGQISRCQGYVNRLMSVVHNQRVSIHKATEATESLESARRMLKLLVESNCQVTSSSDYYKWLSTLGNCAENCLRVIRDFSTLVASLPDELDFDLTPYLREELPPITRCGNRDLAKSAISKLKVHSGDLSTVYEECIKLESGSRSLISLLEVRDVIRGFDVVGNFLDTLLDVINLIGDQPIRGGMFDFLGHFHEECRKSLFEFSCWKQSVLSPSGQMQSQPESSSAGAISSIRNILLGIQRVMVLYEDNKALMNEDNGQSIQLLHSFPAQVLDDLHTDVVLEGVQKAIDMVPLINSEVALLELKGLVLVYDQYVLFHEKVVVDLIVSHCTLCKLLSVLLQTFATLITKGFCTPAEEEVESGENQATDFVDIEAGGFDQGQGETNISDKAEPENIDAGGPADGEEERKDEGEAAQEDNAIDMAEDFEGNMEDMPKDSEGESSSDEISDEEEDRQMGELGSDQAEQLDRNMWAPEDQEDSAESKEGESGGGTTVDEEVKIVAKDDNAGEMDEDEGHDSKPESLDQVAEDENKNESDITNEPNSTDPQEQEERELGDLDLGDMASDSEPEGTVSEDDLVVDSDGEGGESDGEDQMGEKGDAKDTKEDETELPDNDAWAVDQTSYLGTDASALDDNVVNSNASANSHQDQNQGQSTEDGSTLPTSQAQEEDSVSSQLRKPESLGHSAMERTNKRSKGASDSDRLPADDEERAIKRPKLMESHAQSTTSSHSLDQPTKETEEWETYQHLQSESAVKHDAVVWDAAPMDCSKSAADHPQEPRQEEESMDAEQLYEQQEMVESGGDIAESAGISANNVPPTKASQEEDIDKIEAEEESQIAAATSKQLDSGESYFSSGNFIRVDQLDIEVEKAMRDQLLSAVTLLHTDNMQEGALELWLKYENLTFGLSQVLFEELRLILLPTKAAQLKGDFRTGKRLNMRRIIPYIASNFQNNRIWLRRSKPSQREYQVLLAVDDSSSMNENQCIQMAYESLALVSNALSRLEAGQLGVCRFGESVDVLHPLDQPFTASTGASILQNLSFSQTRTSFVQMLQAAQAIFTKSRQNRSSSGSKAIPDQLLLILSDGRGVFADGSLPIEVCIRQLNEMNVFSVFVILDSLCKDSIVDIKVPTFTAGKVVLKTYLETFPFSFYIVLRDIKMMPHVLSQALRQWFELIAEKSFD